MNKPIAQLELIKSEPTSGVGTKAYVDPPQINDGTFWEDNADAIVFHEQPKTAVYENVDGAIVILQQFPAYDDDQIVRIRPENLPALIKVLKAYLP